MGEWKVQKLKHLEEWAEAINKPMFVFFRDPSSKIDIV
jgi:hypothetical protein